jgi:hypothetical protein
MAEDTVVQEENEELTEEQRREALNQIMQGLKTMDTERWGTVVFRHPTIDESAKADMEYSKNFQELVEEGVRTNAQWRKWMREQGVFTKEDEARVRTLQQKLQALSTALADTEEGQASEAIEEQMEEITEELQDLYEEQQAFLQHSAESKAEEGRLMQLMLCCVEDEEGNPVWEDKAALLGEPNDDEMVEVTSGLMQFLRGIPLELSEALQEGTASPEVIGEADGKSPTEPEQPSSEGQSPNGTETK